MQHLLVLVSLVLLNLTSPPASAQEVAADQVSQQQQPLLDAGQLDQLVAPIALYPDPLLAQVLMASTYPLEVVQADRFAKANKKLKGDKLKEALTKQDWDDSVKELVSTPTVLATMSDQLDWTQKLGDAVLAQQADVMDAIQRLRAKAQANGKLETTKQQTVTVKQEADQQVVEIEPASPDVVYVPYYDPAVVYGEWSYPDYPPYYYPPPSGYIVGGAIATGLAWGAAYAVGREIWNDNIDWNGGDINIDVDRNIDIDRNVDIDRNKWQHDSNHRRGVKYNNDAVRNKFAKADARPTDRKLDYRGRTGEQVLKPGTGDRKPGGVDRPGPGGDRPNVGGKGPGQKPDVGQIQQGLKERSGKQAALQGQKPDLGKAKPKSKSGGNAFDRSDGPKAKDFSKRGQASLGNRGASEFRPPSRGGGSKAVSRGGGGRPAHYGGGGRGGGHVSRGGGRGGGGGGRGGGGRRSDIRLKDDIVPLVQLNNGLELYRFRYKGNDRTAYVGVMAQEVQQIEPSAVWRDHDGYLMVDYDRIGVKFMTWKEWLARTGASSSSSLP
jgi:Protein of unknown function (DUF3300)/Chaperone of endosialidase